MPRRSGLSVRVIWYEFGGRKRRPLSNITSKSRLKILKGIKNSIIIDDSYNASPLSIHLALETLRDLPGARRVAVLGICLSWESIQSKPIKMSAI